MWFMDNLFTHGLLVEQLAEEKMFVAGINEERVVGFCDSLRGLKLAKG